LGGGTILDLAVYTIQISQFVFGTEPLSIKATGKLNDDGVDVETEVELRYPNGGVARFKTSALQQLQNRANIRGSKAAMTVSKMNDIWTEDLQTKQNKKKKVICTDKRQRQKEGDG
jgi:dihydrodiol dehydrogenase / D-xylose 1-dehydrogenase (NADP)